MADRTDDDVILLAKDAAARTGLSTSTLAKMRVSGKGPRFVKLGGVIGYWRSSVDEWLHGLPEHQSTAGEQRERLQRKKVQATA